MNDDLQILHGDSLTVLPTLEVGSVQCVVTSPPYYGLRDYGLPPTSWPAVAYAPMAGIPSIEIPAMECCLGLEPTIEAYVGHLVLIWRELWRVMRHDGICWLNLGDSYASGPCGPLRLSNLHGGMDGHRAFRAVGEAKKIPLGLKAKDMMMVPARVALALQADGWYLRSDVIWEKPNVMPEAVQDRPTRSHEYLFLLTKSERYYYDAEAIKERTTGNAHSRGRGITPKGAATDRFTRANNDFQAHTTAIVDRRNKRTVWSIPNRAYRGAHYATFPEKLVEPCILAGCPVGGVVLDPFGGSGTTGRVALAHGRQAILMELNAAYLPQIHERTTGVQTVLEVAA